VYRTRVQEFLVDRKLTQLEKAQLAILAKVLGLSEADANRILQEEQNKQLNVPSAPTQRSWFQRVSNAKTSLFAGVAILAISGGLLAYKQATDNRSNGGFIVNYLSSKCIGVKGADNSNGSPLVLGDCEMSGFNSSNSSPTNQKWILESDGLIKNRTSGKCIGVKGADNSNGSPLVLGDCEISGFNSSNGLPTNQKWILGSDKFIKNRASGKCIDVSGAPGVDNGSPLVLWDCETFGANSNKSFTDQKWDLKY